jgi:hypothetical protein
VQRPASPVEMWIEKLAEMIFLMLGWHEKQI